ncbi:MAG: PorT family protein [Gemmatimonadaceae bacterium]|nr:PorT family protein [Gemmatimonadaceae bacterium]
MCRSSFPVRATLALTFVAVSALSSATASAQRLAILGGGTYSQLRGVENVSVKSRSGTMLGVSLTIPAGESWSFQPEALFLNKGGAITRAAGERQDVRLDYFEIPLLLRREFAAGGTLNPHLYAGPSVGYQLNCKVTVEGPGIPNTSSDCRRDLFLEPASVDWGAVVGAGVDLSLGGLGVTGGARYGFGLANINKDDGAALEQRVRNGTLTVYGGILFGRR